jgi:hypothetical protein
VAVTVLPSTDLYLMGRDRDFNHTRGVVRVHELLRHGVNCSLSTNNVLNPFHSIRRLFAHSHGKHLREYRTRRDARFRRLLRHGDQALGEASAPRRLRPRARQVGGPGGARLHDS